MPSLTIDVKPPIPGFPSTFDTGNVDPEMLKDMFGGWPDQITLVEVDHAKSLFACTNFTTPEPDPMTMGGLCVFPDIEEARAYTTTDSIATMKGKPVAKSLADATELAISKKPKVAALCLMIGSKIVDIRYV